MALFKNVMKMVADTLTAPPKPEAEPDISPDVKLLWRKTFPQASTFRGFRKVYLSRYNHEKVDKAVEYFYKLGENSIDGRTIRLDHVQSKDKHNRFKAVNIYVDDIYIGCVFNSDKERYPMLTEYEYDKVYVLIEETPYGPHREFFVHYPGVAPLKTETRTE